MTSLQKNPCTAGWLLQENLHAKYRASCLLYLGPEGEQLRRGYKGRVVSATESQVRMELEAQYKTVTVPRSQLRPNEGGTPADRPSSSYMQAWPSQSKGRNIVILLILHIQP